MKILWLDDEIQRVTPYCDSLAESGHEITLVSDITEFNEMLANGGWDIVLLDVIMPIGDFGAEESGEGLGTGLVLATRLRQALPDLRIILFTNRMDLASIGEKLDVEVLHKVAVSPWDLEEILYGRAG
jgi:CheY-like chemotaxis protein